MGRVLGRLQGRVPRRPRAQGVLLAGFQFALGAMVLQLLSKMLRITLKSAHTTEEERIIQVAKCHFEENVYGSLDLHRLLRRVWMNEPGLRALFKR